MLSTRAWILLPSPACRRRNPRGCLCRPLFGRLDRLAVEYRNRGAGLPAHLLAQGYVQLGPDRLPDAITLELAHDVVDASSASETCRGAGSARGSRCAANTKWRSSPPACLSWVVARRRCLGDQWLPTRPLPIPQITRIAVALRPINPPGLLCPHRCSPCPVASESSHPTRRYKLLGQALNASDIVRLIFPLGFRIQIAPRRTRSG